MTHGSDTALISQVREALITRLDQGITQLHVDTTREGVDLPESQRGLVQLVLNLSPQMLDRMSLDEDALRARLSFGGVRSPCVIPWEAVYFMRSLDRFGAQVGQGELFAEFIPEALLDQYGLTMKVFQPEREQEASEDPPITQPSDYTLSKQATPSTARSEASSWIDQLEQVPSTKDLSHLWPFPLEVIQNVLDEAEEARSSNSSTPEQGNVWLEGEHTPEHGLFSLRRFKKSARSEDLKSNPSTDIE